MPRLWKLNGEYYELERFAAQHPGGAWNVRHSEGTDITNLFHVYHWDAARLAPGLAKFKCADQAAARAAFAAAHGAHDDVEARPDPVLQSLHRRLRALGHSPRALKTPWWGWAYYAALGAAYVCAIARWYATATYASGVAFGVLGWLFAGYMQHEGSHSALASTPWVNLLGRLTLIPWANPRTWFIKHTVLHHQFTNTALDPDFQTDAGAPIRHHVAVPWRWAHGLQWAVVTVYSPLVAFFYSFGEGQASALCDGESVGYVLAAAALFGSHGWLHAGAFGAWVWLPTLTPFFAFGACFVFITQLSHVQHDAVPDGPLLAAPDVGFVQHQVRTCVDYSHGWAGLPVAVLSIFLNFQTYHHLLPGVSHFHFLTLKPVLDAALAEHGIVLQHASFGQVVRRHFGYMAALSSRHATADDTLRAAVHAPKSADGKTSPTTVLPEAVPPSSATRRRRASKGAL